MAVYDVYEQTLTEEEDCRVMLEEHLEPEMKEMVQGELSLLGEKEKSWRRNLNSCCCQKTPMTIKT